MKHPIARAVRTAGALAVISLLSGCGPALRAWWAMDETAGPVVVDSAGDHDGTATDVEFGRPGQAGAAHGFNGATSIVRVAHADDLNPQSSAFSYSAWVNFTALPPAATWDVLRKGLATSAGGYYKLELFTVNGSARARCHFRDGSGVGLNVGGGNNLQDGRWHQLTCTRTGDRFELRIDGTVVKSSTMSLGSIANSDVVTIGAKQTGTDSFLGTIDDARISVG